MKNDENVGGHVFVLRVLSLIRHSSFVIPFTHRASWKLPEGLASDREFLRALRF
jgi:hypothetical protein